MSRRGRLLPLLAALVALLLAPQGVGAHGVLQSSWPANGDHLSELPREIRLRFNEAVETAVARVTLVGPDSVPVRLGALATPPDSARVLLAPIAGRLRAGTYTVRWQIAGADGHPVRGEYSFLIAPGATGLATLDGAGESTAPAGHHDPVALPTGPGFDAASPAYVAIRWLTFSAVLGVIGAVVFSLLVLRPGGAGAAIERSLSETVRRRSAGIAAAAAGLVLTAAALRLVAQAYALHGPGEAFDGTMIRGMLTRTTWGLGWALQVGGAMVALVGVWRARRGGRWGWGIALAGAIALALFPALSGHAAATERLTTLAVLADTLHVFGAGGWMGGLLVLLAAGVPAAMRLEAGRRAGAVAALVAAFSPAALVLAGLVVATGLLASWLHLPSVSALWETPYGTALLRKLVLVALLFAAGSYNWLRVRPKLGSDAVTGTLRRSAGIELAIGAAVLVLTAILVAVSPSAL